MQTNPLVSVILPVYNTEKYIQESINSILNQTYTPIEIICCDDGSTDNSYEILTSFTKKYPEIIKLVSNKTNSGIAASRNHALQNASGTFFAFMDADDIWEPKKIELQMRQFAQQPELAISFTWMQCFISPDLSDEIKALRYCPPDPSPGYISATALVRKAAFDLVGPFNPMWRVGEFIDWFARAKDLNLEYSIVEEVLFKRRIHATNTGVTERPSRTDYLKIIKQSLDRKKHSD